MSNIEIEALTVKQIYDLAFNVLSKFGCNKENANAIATTVATAESCLLYTSDAADE